MKQQLMNSCKNSKRHIKTVLSSRNNWEPNALSNNTACQVANSETMDLDKNSESANSPDERKTSVNAELSNPSEKESEKINLSQDRKEAVSESL